MSEKFEQRVAEVRSNAMDRLDDSDPRIARAYARTIVAYEEAVESGAKPSEVSGAVMAGADETRKDAGVEVPIGAIVMAYQEEADDADPEGIVDRLREVIR